MLRSRALYIRVLPHFYSAITWYTWSVLSQKAICDLGQSTHCSDARIHGVSVCENDVCIVELVDRRIQRASECTHRRYRKHTELGPPTVDLDRHAEITFERFPSRPRARALQGLDPALRPPRNSAHPSFDSAFPRLARIASSCRWKRASMPDAR